MNQAESRYFATAVKMDQALIALLHEKPFAYITVSEICKKAAVNRSTFYLHYENSSELLEEASRYLLDDFLSCFSVDTQHISTQFLTCGAEELIFVSDTYLLPYLTYIKENAVVFSTALSHVRSFGFDQVFERLFHYILDPILSRFQYPAEQRAHVARFYLSGINAIVREWLREDCRTPIDEMAQIIRVCVFGPDAGRAFEMR